MNTKALGPGVGDQAGDRAARPPHALARLPRRLARSARPGALVRVARAGGLAIGLALSGGCYTYVPVRPGEAEPGRPVRAALTERGAVQVVPILGPGVREVEGLVVERSDSAVSILLESYFSGRQGGWVGAVEPLRLPAEAIAGLEQRQLSVGRSVLLGVAFAAGAVMAARFWFGGDRTFLPDDSSDEPGPQQARLPVHLSDAAAPGFLPGGRAAVAPGAPRLSW